jgi:monoamine oxidase
MKGDATRRLLASADPGRGGRTSSGRGGRSTITRRRLARGETPSTPRPATVRQRVLVLGAGIAGLTAAVALHRVGHDVTVIEYQDRVGGRLLSIPLANGQVSEAGGAHLRANMPLALGYAGRFGMKPLSLNEGLPRYFVKGETADAARLADWPWDLADQEHRVTVPASLSRYLVQHRLDTLTVLDPAWPDEETINRLDGHTIGDLLQQVGASNAFLDLLNAHEGTFSDRSAALGAMPDLAYHFGDQNLFRIKGGNEQLPQAMAELLGDRIVLGAPVVVIDQTGPRVHVTVKDGRSFTGDAVICTIPFTVLQDVEVRPAWTAAKRKMFEEMVWGNTVKVVVQTQAPSWLAHGVHGWPMAGGDRIWERLVDITGNEPGGHGNAFFYINGANADAVLALPPERRATEVLHAFQADIPGLVDDVITLQAFAWPEQPWIRGSFGDPPTNGGWMIAEWSPPEDRIHLAGDFTTMKSGWIEGAIESGLRAARQIDPAAPAESGGYEARPRYAPFRAGVRSSALTADET